MLLSVSNLLSLTHCKRKQRYHKKKLHKTNITPHFLEENLWRLVHTEILTFYQHEELFPTGLNKQSCQQRFLVL